jgi:hypothetical protein
MQTPAVPNASINTLTSCSLNVVNFDLYLYMYFFVYSGNSFSAALFLLFYPSFFGLPFFFSFCISFRCSFMSLHLS